MVKKCHSNQKWNNGKCLCEFKNPKEYRVCEKNYILNSTTCSCINGKSIVIIIDDSVITCDEIKEQTKTVPKNNFTYLFINYYGIVEMSIETKTFIIISRQK